MVLFSKRQTLVVNFTGIFLEKSIRGGKLGFPKIEEGQRYVASGLLYMPTYVASVGKGGSIYETTAGGRCGKGMCPLPREAQKL